MRNIYLLWGLLTCIAFTSCYEEDALTPTEGGIELRFKVPQGTNSWDDDISQIQKDFGVYLIIKICKMKISIVAGQEVHPQIIKGKGVSTMKWRSSIRNL